MERVDQSCCHSLREELERLTKELEDERNLFSSFEEESKNYEDELLTENSQLQAELKTLRARLEATKADSNVWKERWKTARDEAQDEMNVAMAKLERMTLQEENYRKRNVELESDYDALENAQRTVSHSIHDLDAKYTALLEENVLLRAELESVNDNKAEIAHLQEEIRDLKLEISVLRDRDRQLATHFWRNQSRNVSQTSLAVSPTAVMLRAYGMSISRTNSAIDSIATLHTHPMPGQEGSNIERLAEDDQMLDTAASEGVKKKGTIKKLLKSVRVSPHSKLKRTLTTKYKQFRNSIVI